MFEPLFTYLSVDRITATAVLQLSQFPADMNDCEQVIAGMLREFILSCREEGKFLCNNQIATISLFYSPAIWF